MTFIFYDRKSAKIVGLVQIVVAFRVGEAHPTRARGGLWSMRKQTVKRFPGKTGKQRKKKIRSTTMGLEPTIF